MITIAKASVGGADFATLREGLDGLAAQHWDLLFAQMIAGPPSAADLRNSVEQAVRDVLSGRERKRLEVIDMCARDGVQIPADRGLPAGLDFIFGFAKAGPDTGATP